MKYIFSFLIILSAILLILPILPKIIFYSSSHKNSASFIKEVVTAQAIEKNNTLFIPSISVKVPIVEGENESSLSKGAWHIPHTGDPLKGNMVIGGHRFQYLPPNNTTFYNLDKVNKGDIIYITWNGSIYKYRVFKIFSISAYNLDILNQTINPTITVFTCTPLWSATNRLVIQAIQIENT